MWIFLFTILVTAMTLLAMYRKEQNALKRMMARGRCGLPGIPNPNFNSIEGVCNEEDEEQEKDPFEKQMKSLSKIIVGKRKQILISRDRVTKAEDELKTLQISTFGLRRKYESIMDDLKEELEDAEEECKELSKFVDSANSLKSKFFSTDDECDGPKALPAPPNKGQRGGCGAQGQRKRGHDCHPPIPKRSNQQPYSCACPDEKPSPLSTCNPPASQACRGSNNFSNTEISNSPCPPPLPSLMQRNGSSPMLKRMPSSGGSQGCTDGHNCPPKNHSMNQLNSSPSSSREPSIPRSCPSRSTSRSSMSSGCPPPSGCPSPCPPPPGPPPCPPSNFVKRPPFSSFYGERMPAQPVQRRVRQTVFTECIDDDDDNGSQKVVTELRTSSITFPPNCCMSVYEDFMNTTTVERPKVKLPIIIDPCDPCDTRREFSPFEDIENVTHSCGTQTGNDPPPRSRCEEGRKRSSGKRF